MSVMISVLKKIKSKIELITETQISIKRKPRVNIQVHEDAVSNGESMLLYVDLVERICNFHPKNIFEIGANYGQDAEFLRKSFGLKPSDVYVFEPHPQIFSSIQEFYDFNCYKLAVSNAEGHTTFHAIDIENNEYKNSGISTLKDGLTTNKENFFDVEAELVRMDEFIRKNKVETIDFLKIDVEGANYEVLEGFGKELSKVKVIQTEGEYSPYWKGQKLYHDMETLLVDNGFLLVHFLLSRDGIQSDSLWVQKKYIKRV